VSRRWSGRSSGQRAITLAENLVQDARVRQGRQCRLLLPKRAEVQNEVALKELTSTEAARIGALVKKAVS